MIIGIDLGTSTSEVSVYRNGRAELIRDVRGSTAGILPSVVGVNSRGRLDIGVDVLHLGVVHPEMVAEEVKRLMGTGSTVTLGAESFTPQEISAMILRRLKESAEAFLGTTVTEAVVTVPANFNEYQRRATQEAAELAGLKVRRLINEPTAAALSYGINRQGVEERILVYDLGGGTLDVTVLELSEGVFDVLASAGIPKLGGKDFDTRLMTYLARECRRRTSAEPTEAKTITKLRSAARRAKHVLSTETSFDLVVDHIGIGPDGMPQHLEMEITRETFDDLIRDLVESSRAAIDEVLRVRGLAPSDIDTVLLVGGSTRIPLVRSFVSSYFGGRDLRTDVNPDEAVSLGAAILAGMEAGTVPTGQAVITDVAPHSFGIAVTQESEDGEIDGAFSPLIRKQSTIPRTERKVFRTAHDWQEKVLVQVFQGEAAMCAENLPVCDFEHPMVPAPAGAQVGIEFSYNLDGRINIVVEDVAAGGRTVHECLTGPSQLSPSDKASAQRRIDEKWQTGSSAPSEKSPTTQPTSTPQRDATLPPWASSPLWRSVAALHEHASRRLDGLPPAHQRAVKELLGRLQTAATRGDAKTLQVAEDELTNLLFDLEV